MSETADAAAQARRPRQPVDIRASARLLGTLHAGPGVYLAQGTVVRALAGSVRIGARSMVLENSVVVGSPDRPVTIGQKVVFGHRSLIIGAEVGDLCEIGNATILLPGTRLGRRCFLGEGTLLPAGAEFPDNSVIVGRPGRLLRRVRADDIARLTRLRGGDLECEPFDFTPVSNYPPAGGHVGQLYAYLDKQPQVDPSAILFDSAEITGDVVIGPDCIIGAGVKIIGDSHGPVRIGARVQILENTVLHLLPDNTLVLEDDVLIGPGAMIHGCQIGAGSVIEPGAIVCDWSRLGRHCHVTAGSLVPQRAVFGDRTMLDGFPVRQIATLTEPPAWPAWALRRTDLATLVRLGRSRRPMDDVDM